MDFSSNGLENIINGCKNNLEHHKEALYKGFYGYVKGVVIRYVNDQFAAEELVNDSFIKIFNKLDTFHSIGRTTDLGQSFKGWIAKIASRTAIDSLRKKKIDFNNDDFNDHNAPALNSGYAHTTEAKEILKLLNELPQTQKAIFNLYEIEGYSHEEISGLLSIPVNVSRSYLSRAKSRLKSLYIEKF